MCIEIIRFKRKTFQGKHEAQRINAYAQSQKFHHLLSNNDALHKFPFLKSDKILARSTSVQYIYEGIWRQQTKAASSSEAAASIRCQRCNRLSVFPIFFHDRLRHNQ